MVKALLVKPCQITELRVNLDFTKIEIDQWLGLRWIANKSPDIKSSTLISQIKPPNFKLLSMCWNWDAAWDSPKTFDRTSVSLKKAESQVILFLAKCLGVAGKKKTDAILHSKNMKKRIKMTSLRTSLGSKSRKVLNSKTLPFSTVWQLGLQECVSFDALKQPQLTTSL